MTDASPDLLLRLSSRPRGAALLRRLGLPAPVPLERAAGPWRGDELAGLRVAVAGPGDAADLLALSGSLQAQGALLDDGTPGPLHGIVLDARQFALPADLHGLHPLFAHWLPQLARQARIVVLAPDAGACGDPAARATVTALDGFVRSLGKELGRRAAAVNRISVPAAGSPALAATVAFLLGRRSGFIAGQGLALAAARPLPEDVPPPPAPPPGPQVLAGQTAVVTGAAGGIGAATAHRLAEEGAHVLCVDIPARGPALERLAAAVGGSALVLDIAAPGAGDTLAAAAAARGGVDVMVHNAGITRDRTLARMPAEDWAQVLAVDLEAVIGLDAALDAAGAWRPGARTVCLSSINGLAGAAGQTHYAAAKAGLVGYVQARGDRLAADGAAINAVAPGFIETAMTARLPWMIGQAGRRLSALSQGGQPRDVAEAIAFLALPMDGAIQGQVLRVCGQSFLGA